MPDTTTEVNVQLTDDEKREIEEKTGHQVDEVVVPSTTEDSDSVDGEHQAIRF